MKWTNHTSAFKIHTPHISHKKTETYTSFLPISHFHLLERLDRLDLPHKRRIPSGFLLRWHEIEHDRFRHQLYAPRTLSDVVLCQTHVRSQIAVPHLLNLEDVVVVIDLQKSVLCADHIATVFLPCDGGSGVCVHCAAEVRWEALLVYEEIFFRSDPRFV